MKRQLYYILALLTLFSLGFATADPLCDFAHPNMYEYIVSQPLPRVITYENQEIFMQKPVVAPHVNTLPFHAPQVIVVTTLDQFHMVPTPCCEQPLVNNFVMPIIIEERPVVLDSIHLKQPCCNF